MIWNRPTNLWLGALTATFNVIVIILASNNIEVPDGVVGAVNVAFLAVITLVAGQPPVVSPTDTVTVKTNNGHTDKRVTFNEAGFAITHPIPGTEHNKPEEDKPLIG